MIILKKKIVSPHSLTTNSAVLWCIHTDRSDSYSASDSSMGSLGICSNIIEIGHRDR